MGAHRYINDRKLPLRREEHNTVQVDLLFRISRFVAFSLFRISCFGFRIFV
jgi:hypothetical protein